MGAKRRRERRERQQRLAGQSVTPANLTALEKKAAEDQRKTQQSRTLTPAGRRATLVDQRNEFRDLYANSG